MAERILTLRELNRATLARQLLLERASLAPLEAIKRLVGLQGQVSNAPYVGLWTRLRAFRRADLTALLEQRQVVRASSLRGTLHILAAEDYLRFQPVLQPALSRNLQIFARQTEGFDMERFVAAMQAYVREQPRAAVELRAKMEELYPGMGRQQIADSVRMFLALIQIPPAGTWGFTGRPVHMEAAVWLGSAPVASENGLRELILRYLAAFGPASVKDMQTWSGLSRVQETIDVLRPELRTFRDEQGRELFDLLDGPLPAAESPAPVRFLPEFDNLLFAHADRRRVLADEYRSRIFISNVAPLALLIDGFVHGTWKIERASSSATLVIEPFEPLTDQVRQAVQEEGERLVRWIADDAETFAVRFSTSKYGI